MRHTATQRLALHAITGFREIEIVQEATVRRGGRHTCRRRPHLEEVTVSTTVVDFPNNGPRFRRSMCRHYTPTARSRQRNVAR